MFAPDRDGDATDAGRVAFVRRTARVFEIFEEVFTGDHRARLVKVVPVWMGDWRHSERIMQLYHDPVNNPNAVAANAMAVAPYFGWIVPVAVIHNNEQHSVSVEEILRRAALNIDTDQPDPLGYDGIDEGIETMIKQHKPIADKYGMEMIAYEGGSHLALIEGADEPLATKLVEANRSPQMYELYERLLGVWFENGGGLFVAFSYTQSYNKWGSFGHLEWMDQPIEQSHKLRALLDRINK
jgi:hypothetical protein